MEYFRDELLPDVYFTALRTDRFKTGCMSAVVLTPLRRETAAAHACIPYILRRGTVTLPDIAALNGKLDELYGAGLEPLVRKLGEIHCPGFVSTFCEDRFLPGDASVTEEMARLLGQVWLHPGTRGGLFRPDYVESESAKLVQRIESLVNNKRLYARRRLCELMCPYEDYAVSAMGDVHSAEALHYVGLTKDYKSMLASSPMEFFYCGGTDPRRVRDYLSAAFMSVPRGEVDLDIGTDIRMNTVEEETRCFTEEMELSQGRLAIGYRLGECMDDPDPAALMVFNALLGGSPASRLFTHVREKLSLCYDVSSVLDMHKGVLIISAGIQPDNYSAAMDEIRSQLEALARGDFSDRELEAAARYTASALRSAADSPLSLESFYLSQTVMGLEYGPMEMAALAESVRREDVAGIARSLVSDAVYFLRNEEEAQE